MNPPRVLGKIKSSSRENRERRRRPFRAVTKALDKGTVRTPAADFGAPSSPRVVDAWDMHKAPISAQIERLWSHSLGQRIRWSWPQDGHQGSGSEDGASIVRRLKDAGVLVNAQHARTKEGSNKREDGVAVMREFMNDRKFFVSDHLHGWFSQYSNYHYDDHGKIKQSFCDLLDATRTAVVDLRYARALSEYDQIPRRGRAQQQRAAPIRIAKGATGDDGSTPWGFDAAR